MTTSGYLDRWLDPVMTAFTPELAQKLLETGFDEPTQERIEELRQRADSGAMTPDEEAEYRDFVEALDVVSLLQWKGEAVSRRARGLRWTPPFGPASAAGPRPATAGSRLRPGAAHVASSPRF